MSSSVLVWGGQGKQSEPDRERDVQGGMWPGEMREDALAIVERNMFHDHTITERREHKHAD
jgi:hypothetical protein